MPRLYSLTLFVFAHFFASGGFATTTNKLLDLNFNNTNETYPGWGSTSLTGTPGAGVSVLKPTTVWNSSFPTAPTSGYLALTTDASAVNTNTYYGGWAANVTLGQITSLYSNGGFGQTNLAKIKFTAKVRARGMPASNGAVVILKLAANTDNPNSVPWGYKRVMFEPIFLAGNDWTTIGGTLDDASMSTSNAQGTRYNFPLNASAYNAIVELSGFNQFGTTNGYLAYNGPTTIAMGGRKNPGFGFTGGIRVEIDDVQLTVLDADTTGFISANTPSQLLNNWNFGNAVDAGAFWTFFEGAYVSTDGWGVSSTPCAIIPGWSGLPYAGFMQNAIKFSQTNGEFFTLSFQAKFEKNYKAAQTLVSFMNGNDTATFSMTDLTDEVAPRLDKWSTYKATFRATSSNLVAMNGQMSVKIQPLGRTVGADEASVLIDDIVLQQQTAASVGPQIAVKVAGATRTNGETASLFSPLIGKTTTYALKLENQGGQDLTLSSVALSGTGFAITGNGSSVTLAPGESKTYSLTASPSSLGTLSGTLTINSNDKESADQTYVVNLATSAVNLSDDFNGAATLDELGWKLFSSHPNMTTASTTSVMNDDLKMDVNSSRSVADYPWYYGVVKTFASPGALDISASSMTAVLKASGKYIDAANNKVQVRLESLNSAGAVTGSIALGTAVDETTVGASPGSPAYFTPDGITDRYAILLPEGGSYTTGGGPLASSGQNTTFNPNAPAFRIVIQMTDFDFDLDTGNIVQVDSVNAILPTKPFTLVNGSFETGTYTLPLDPAAVEDFWKSEDIQDWAKYPVEGVSKAIVNNGDPIYNAAKNANDLTSTFTAYAGSRALKVYGQNYYVGNVWQGPVQKGTVYQEFQPGSTPGLGTGAVIHASGVAKVFSIDPLTGGSTLNFGFKYLDGADIEIGRDVTSLTASTMTADTWVPLTANGTVPAGAVKVQLMSEFVQNASTDKGAVYLDDLSVGYGSVTTTTTIAGQTYRLKWSDEFDGTSLNSANWVAEAGRGPNNDGWGNQELQTYTTNNANLRVENGSLILQAVKSGNNWTSARIKSQGLRSFKYGKIEFRAKLPTGIGPWPAAWLLGTNISSVNWPTCGEIDVMEWRAGYGGSTNDVNTVGHALHSALQHGSNPVEPSSRSAVANPSGAFHTYAVLWNSNNLIFSVDGVDKATLTPPPGDVDAFRQEFFLLLNLAVGGAYLGGSIDSALNSATYEVDYVRVYQSSSVPVVSDTTPPVITLLGTNPALVNWGATYSDANATAFDAGDNATVTVLANNPVNTAVPGSYLVTYTATDSRSNTATTNRTVKVSMSNGGTNRGTDGLSDALRYAYGGTGTNPISTSLLPSNSIISSNLVLTYFARTNSNVTLTPVVSTDLSVTNSWTNSGVSNSILGTITTNGTVLEKRQATTPVSGPKKFLKLNVLFTNP